MPPEYVKGLSVGIVLGILLAFALLAGISFWALYRERREQDRRERMRIHLQELERGHKP
jgi:hypothetical protein